jgi:hypothetical protein
VLPQVEVGNSSSRGVFDALVAWLFFLFFWVSGLCISRRFHVLVVDIFPSIGMWLFVLLSLNLGFHIGGLGYSSSRRILT